MILDLTLQGEFGADLLTELADRDDAPSTVIVSAFPLAPLVAERFSVELVRKPFDLDEVIERVRTAKQVDRRPRRLRA